MCTNNKQFKNISVIHLKGVRRLASKYLSEPIQLYVGTLDLRAAKSVRQHLVMINDEDARKDCIMNYIMNDMDPNDKVIVFVGRKTTADSLSCDLAMKDIICQSIHGDREQSDREQALDDFKANRGKLLPVKILFWCLRSMFIFYSPYTNCNRRGITRLRRQGHHMRVQL
jgi:superfamily II DNA/RNA helicase